MPLDPRPPAAYSVHLDDFRPDKTGAGSSATAFSNALTALAARANQARKLVIAPGIYIVPDGIVTEMAGLTVEGGGHRAVIGPTGQAQIGVVIKSTTAGAWCWTHKIPDGASANEYRGVHFENITFQGDADTGGGLRILGPNNNSIVNCGAYGHTTGTGFLIGQSAAATNDDASWDYLEDCHACDCLTGFDIGGSTGTKSTGSHLVSCHTLKTTAGGILHTGTGFAIRSQNVTVLGGKAESDADGFLVTANTGVTMYGIRVEGCTRGVHLNRPSDPGFASRIKVMGLVSGSSTTTPITVGSNQKYDALIGCQTFNAISDSGTNTLILGDTGSGIIGLKVQGTTLGPLSASNVTANLLWSDVLSLAFRRSDALGSTGSMYLYGQRNRAGAVPNNTDELITIGGQGYDGVSTYRDAGSVKVRVRSTGTRSATSMPGEVAIQTSADGSVTPADRVIVRDTGVTINPKVLAAGGIGVGNSAAATTPGSVVRKIEIFDASGASLGFIPVYNTIT